MKNYIIIPFLLFAPFLFSQEASILKKIQIGKFEYIIGISENHFLYEENINVINFDLQFKNMHQLIGAKMTYRKPNSSANYIINNDENIPKDKRASYKDGVILSLGDIDINVKEKSIIVSEKTIIKDNEEQPELRISKFKQMRNGFFELIKLIEFNDGKENVILNKE